MTENSGAGKTGNALRELCENRRLDLSGDSILAVYRIAGDEATARTRAADICLEQTVELPDIAIPQCEIRDHVIGKVEGVRSARPSQIPLPQSMPSADSHPRNSQTSSQFWDVEIRYSVESAGGELTQLLNLLFGNISIKPGIRLMEAKWPDSLLRRFRGPRFGRQGIRNLLGVHDRPLLSTALKPMGLSAQDLAKLAYDFAMGGIDIIKDDHGLSNQNFAPFEERVRLCSDAVRRADAQTGRRTLYMPSVTAPAHLLRERALFAKRAGAGGLLVCPGIVGLDSMRMVADDDEIALPIMAHPALQGSFVASPGSGISHGFLFGTLARLAGADATVYPNYGGRFSFSQEEAFAIVRAGEEPLGDLRPILPVPAGGMTMDRVEEMVASYGKDVIFLMGGGLYTSGSNLVENSRRFLDRVTEAFLKHQ